MIKTVALDADDTLWQNERFFQMSQERFTDLLSDFVPAEDLSQRLLAAERRNLGRYGYGIKGFVLSMIETALDVSDQKVSGAVVSKLIEAGHDMLAHPIELLPGVQTAVQSLAAQFHLVLITKGDLLDQERKLAQSGLGDYFDAVEVVSEKSPEIYARLFARHGLAATSVMAGNSVRSDVIAPIEAGAYGVFVPHGYGWEIEAATPPRDHPKFRQIAELAALPTLLGDLV